jgi:hypothetical protein
MSLDRVIETKRHLQKSDEVYECRRLAGGDGWALLDYVNENEASVGDRKIPPGSLTVAWYQDGCGWVLWKMSDPEGRLLGHLFHVVRDLTVASDGVSYTDLVLDLWVDGESGESDVLDEEELVAEAFAGRICESDARAASAGLRELQLEAAALIDGLDRLLIRQSL